MPEGIPGVWRTPKGGNGGGNKHEFSLSWLDRHVGTGHDSVRISTRREYQRLLVNFALTYFDREVRCGSSIAAAVQHFVDWLTTRPRRTGRPCDRSIANALTPLRLALDAAVAGGLLAASPAGHVVLPGGGPVAPGRRASDAF